MAEETKPKKKGRGCLVKGLIALLVLVFGCALCIFNSDEHIATSPDRIASRAGFSLPDYDVISQDDNMNRTASAWSWYDWSVKTKKPLTDDEIAELKALVAKDDHWTYNAKKNEYSYEKSDKEVMAMIVVSANDGTIRLNYSWYDMFA